jgi:hypothetical protein
LSTGRQHNLLFLYLALTLLVRAQAILLVYGLSPWRSLSLWFLVDEGRVRFAVLVERDRVSFGDEGDNVHYANG